MLKLSNNRTRAHLNGQLVPVLFVRTIQCELSPCQEPHNSPNPRDYVKERHVENAGIETVTSLMRCANRPLGHSLIMHTNKSYLSND